MHLSAARIAPAVVLAALVAALPGLLGVAAHAGDGTLHVTGAPLDVSRLAPGSHASSAVEVSNDSGYLSRLDLRATDVVQAENSCEPPERRIPTERCSADGGELGNWLVVSVSRDEPSHQVLWAGSMRQLEAGATLSESMPAGASWPLRVSVELPFAATNDTMTDSIGFGLRFIASSQDTVSEVSGPHVDAGVPTGTGRPGLLVHAATAVFAPLAHGPRVGLPMTGATISLWMLLLDLVLLVAGGLLLARSRKSA